MWGNLHGRLRPPPVAGFVLSINKKLRMVRKISSIMFGVVVYFIVQSVLSMLLNVAFDMSFPTVSERIFEDAHIVTLIIAALVGIVVGYRLSVRVFYGKKKVEA